MELFEVAAAGRVLEASPRGSTGQTGLVSFEATDTGDAADGPEHAGDARDAGGTEGSGDAVDAGGSGDAVEGGEVAGASRVVVDRAVVAVAEVGGVACADALAASRAAIVAAEATQVALVAAWADLCNADSGQGDGSSNGSGTVPGDGFGDAGRVGGVLAGTERVVRGGAVGTPRVREVAAAELGVDRPRISRTASNRAFYAAVLLFRYSLWTSCGVR
jgi:hypothetical protein